MKQRTLLFVACYLLLAASLHAQNIDSYRSAVQAMASKSLLQHKASPLTDALHKKQVRLRREERIKERQAERLNNYIQKKKRMDVHSKQIHAHRTTASFRQEAKQLHRQKKHERKVDQGIKQQRQSYISQQEQILQESVARHNAARNALLNNS